MENGIAETCDVHKDAVEGEKSRTRVFFTETLDSDVQRELVHQKVQELISKDGSDTVRTIHLGQCGWEAVGKVVSPTYFAMTLCRKFNLLSSERCVLLPLRDQYQAIQLCLARINKKKNGTFEAPVSDVLDVWNELYRETVTLDETTKLLTAESDDDCKDLNLPSSRRESYDPVVREMKEIVDGYQDFLQSSGCIDHFSLFSALKCQLEKEDVMEYIGSKAYIIEGVRQMPTMERELLKLLLSEAQVLKVSISVPLVDSKSYCEFDMSGIGDEVLNTSQENADINNHQESKDDESNTTSDSVPSVIAEDLDSSVTDYVEEIPRSPGTTDFSESELYVEQLVLAHIRLLINTRDELALATLCSMPGREITQQGFYGIKDEAQKKNMPMYQTILSFIMRLRLGGKGYQADPNCPLLLHSKPLGEFVDSVMKLQNIVEEEPNPRKGAVRVLSLIKSGLLRIRGRALKGSCIEKVWDSLYNAFDRLTKVDGDGESKESAGNFKNQQTTAALRPCLKLLLELCDEASGRIMEEIVDVLGENFLTQCSSSKKTTTPIRIPTVLSLFGSPVEGSPVSKLKGQEEDHEDSLRMRLMRCKGLTPKNASAPRFKSGCSWAPDDLSPVGKSDGTHDTTLSPIVGPTLKALGSRKRESSSNWREIVDSVSQLQDEMRKESELSPLKHQKPVKNSKEDKTTDDKRSKRSLLSDISNIAADNSNKKSKSSGAVKKSKTKPIPKGQKSITSFFKV